MNTPSPYFTPMVTTCARDTHSDISLDKLAQYLVNSESRKLYSSYCDEVSIHEGMLISLRHRFFLDRIRDFLSDGGTLINLASSLTLYPYYLKSNVSTVEMDSFDRVKLKEKWLTSLPDNTPEQKISRIPIELNSLADCNRLPELLQPLVKPSNKAFFLLEGLVYYLPKPNLSKIFEAIKAIPAIEKRIGLVYWPPKIATNSNFQKAEAFLKKSNVWKNIHFYNKEDFLNLEHNWILEESPNFLDIAAEIGVTTEFQTLDEIFYENFLILSEGKPSTNR